MSLLTQLVGSARGVTARSLLALPRPVIRRLAGAPVVIDGRTLDPEMQLLLRLQRIEGPAVETLPIRKGRANVVSTRAVVGGSPPIGAVTDRTIDGPGGPLTLRFYTPRGLTGDAPALVFFHGGGWIYGDLDSHDATCRFLAEEAQVRVVAVDYRLAPEAPFPAAFDDVVGRLDVDHRARQGHRHRSDPHRGRRRQRGWQPRRARRAARGRRRGRSSRRSSC